MSQLRRQVKKLQVSAKKQRQADYDPEDEQLSKPAASDDESDTDASEDETFGREHYQAVGNSKLRKPQKAKLDDKKYGGQAVSRDQIFRYDGNADVLAPDEEEDDDPFAAPSEEGSESEGDESDGGDETPNDEDVDGVIGEDDEIDSDEAFEDGEEDQFRGKGFVFRGSGQELDTLPEASGDEESEISNESLSDGSDIAMEDFDGTEEGEESEDTEHDLEDQDDEDDEDDREAEDEFNARPRPSTIKPSGNSDRERLRDLISNDTAALASSLSASLSADAKKGVAVKKQYQTFDRLLDARIKLQKGLTASNDLPAKDTVTNEEIQTAYQKAEEAALKLYSTIESLRQSILETNSLDLRNGEQDSRKRKRPTPLTHTTSTSTLWSRISTLETQNLPTRRQTLDKWSAKTRTAAPIASTASKLSNNPEHQQSQSKLSTVLDAYLSSETSKLQSTSQTSTQTYDDATFYQSLLRDLINSRTTAATSNANANLPIVPLKLHPSGNTTKTRKVDVKASKGRKVRYTVHEKLENFMASEGRGNSVGQWNDGAVREFFGSLLGQRGMLGEDEVDGEGDDQEAEALRLFRT